MSFVSLVTCTGLGFLLRQFILAFDCPSGMKKCTFPGTTPQAYCRLESKLIELVGDSPAVPQVLLERLALGLLSVSREALSVISL